MSEHEQESAAVQDAALRANRAGRWNLRLANFELGLYGCGCLFALVLGVVTFVAVAALVW